MIAFLKGRLVEKTPTDIIIDCNGIGYQVHISLHSYSLIKDAEAIQIHTYLQIKEDAHILYGFIEKTERELFKLLISVSGIGGNTARNMLSYVTPKDLINAIASNDLKTIQSIKGIGLKTAQRIILDLQGKSAEIVWIRRFICTCKQYKCRRSVICFRSSWFCTKSYRKSSQKNRRAKSGSYC